MTDEGETGRQPEPGGGEGVQVRWDEHGLVPAVVQDAATGQVLMLAYMNREALDRTLNTGETWFWSRSRGALWHKGETSGHVQRLLDLRYDCDADALLLRVDPAGPACHTGQQTCFYRRLPGAPETGRPARAGSVVDHLEAIIAERQANPRPESYTCQLLEAGLPLIAKKLGEEASEVVVAALAEADERLASELADLVYHGLVLLAARGLAWADVEAALASRFR